LSQISEILENISMSTTGNPPPVPIAETTLERTERLQSEREAEQLTIDLKHSEAIATVLAVRMPGLGAVSEVQRRLMEDAAFSAQWKGRLRLTRTTVSDSPWKAFSEATRTLIVEGPDGFCVEAEIHGEKKHPLDTATLYAFHIPIEHPIGDTNSIYARKPCVQ
jgi:hypothetical protein